MAQVLQLKFGTTKTILYRALKKIKAGTGTGGARVNNLKKQMDQIDIPESLHQRSLQGIEQAKKRAA